MLLLWGCGHPSRANIELRKQIDSLHGEVATLNRTHQADLARIQSMEAGIGTLPTLPEDRLAQLVTTHGLRLGKLTGGYGAEPQGPGDKGVVVYVVPTDGAGEDIKAAGSLTVEVFDLADAEGLPVARCTYDLEQARQHWNGSGLLYMYVLQCPWQRVPRHGELTVRVTFLDALTQRVFTAQRVIHITPPSSAATGPATRAIAQP